MDLWDSTVPRPTAGVSPGEPVGTAGSQPPQTHADTLERGLQQPEMYTALWLILPRLDAAMQAGVVSRVCWGRHRQEGSGCSH